MKYIMNSLMLAIDCKPKDQDLSNFHNQVKRLVRGLIPKYPDDIVEIPLRDENRKHRLVQVGYAFTHKVLMHITSTHAFGLWNEKYHANDKRFDTFKRKQRQWYHELNERLNGDKSMAEVFSNPEPEEEEPKVRRRIRPSKPKFRAIQEGDNPIDLIYRLEQIQDAELKAFAKQWLLSHEVDSLEKPIKEVTELLDKTHH